MSNSNNRQEPQPVYLAQSIPMNWEHRVTPEAIAAEGIPTPENLCISPELARGGMGRIHVATDRNLLRHVALKRLDRQLAEVPMYRDGFIAEAQMTGQLEHPNIVPVHQLAVSEIGVPYFTMKLVQGVSFDAWMRAPHRGVGTTERLHEGLEIFVKVCDAMAYAHHRGVIHRDLKPENIMVADFGQVYLMDWGLARLIRQHPSAPRVAQMDAHGAVGTPEFMAPEQARGNPAEMDERSDVFGLGAVLYELAAGISPYGGLRDPDAVLERARRGHVIAVENTSEGTTVPKPLCAIINRAVAPLPENRYQSVIELQSDLRKFLRGGMYLPRQTFQPGSIIMREGERGDTAYMIVRGTCRAFRTTPQGPETLSTMRQGDVFGEMALLLDEPRAASVEATDQVTALVLDKQTMTEGLGIDGWTGSLVRALAQRFRTLEQQVRETDMRRRLSELPQER